LRIVSSIAGLGIALGIALALAACASPNGGAPVPAAGTAQSSEFGNYLSARFAASQHNLKDAAVYYRASLADDPDNHELLALAFFFATSSAISTTPRVSPKKSWR